MRLKDRKFSDAKLSSKKITLVLGFFTALSRVLGFFRQIVFVQFFGAGHNADIFNFAFNIPNNLRKLLAEGALSSAYIPVISGALEDDKSRQKASRIVRTVLTFQLLIIIPLLIVFIAGADQIVSFLSDFSAPMNEKAVDLFRFLIIYLLLVSISAILTASLNSVSKFIIPAITPILFSFSVIGSVLIFHKTFGLYAMVIGVLVGGVAQIIFLVPQFLLNGFSLRPSFNFRSEAFRKIMLRYFPVVLSSGVFMVLQMFAHYLGSKMEEGSISAIANSLVIWQLPFGIFSVSIMTVLFPRMSRQSHLGDKEGLKESIEEGISGFLAFIIPSSLFLFLSQEITVSAIYFRGEFSVENVLATTSVLKAYSVGIFSVSSFHFLQRFFFADHNYLVPFLGAVVVAFFDVLFSITFYKLGLGAAGLAWANTIAFSVGFIFLWVMTTIRLKGFNIKGVIKTFLKVSISMIPLVIVLLTFNFLFPEIWKSGSNLQRMLVLSIIVILTTIPVLGLYILLKVEVFSDIVISRFRRK